MMQVNPNVIIWLIVWSIIGSTLGFFTIRFKPIWTTKKKVLEYLLSVNVGIFFALPIYIILLERYKFSEDLCIMLAGSSSFAITDVIIKIWPKLINGLGYAINKYIDKILGNSNSNTHEQE